MTSQIQPTQLRSRPNDPRRGQAAMLVTFSITFLCGMIGLVVDLGWGYYKKQSVQAAAESAALAAASWAKSNSTLCASGGLVCTTANCANVASGSELYVGCQYAKQNGYTDGTNNQAVTISANTGASTSAPGVSASAFMVTATVSETVWQTFSRVLGSGPSMTVRAQATAAVPYGRSPYCVYALATTGTGITVTGNGTLNMGCGMFANSSDSSQAALVTGSGSLTITGGGKLKAHGTVKVGGSGSLSPAGVSNQTAVTDPYAALQGAGYTPTTGTCQPNPSGGTIGPGTYCSQINIGGSNSLTMTQGTYILQHGINWDSSGTLTGTNVTLYVPAGSVTESAGTWNLTAPTTGTYSGITIYQAASNSSAMSFGPGTLTGNGVIYAPSASMTFTGNGSSSSSAMTLVGKTLTFTGDSSVTTGAMSSFTAAPPGLVQ